MARTNGGISGRTGDQVSSILAYLETSRTLSEQSFPRVEDLAERFGRFVRLGLGKGSLAEVTAADASLFLTAPSDVGAPSVATLHLRRSMLRLLFRTARRLELVEGDPTLDLELPRRTNLRTRPLDDEEVALCRSASLHTLTSTRLAAAWALSEATARTAELPRLTAGDLDLARHRVWIHGGGRTVPRWGALSPWAMAQLDRHLSRLPAVGPDQPLVYRGSGSAHSKQASACMVVGEVLVRAGLAGEPDVRPLSVTAWAGQQVLVETGRLEEVARRLGVRSLDRAARLIAFDWADQ
jgi:integrase